MWEITITKNWPMGGLGMEMMAQAISIDVLFCLPHLHPEKHTHTHAFILINQSLT